ncbi:MAG: DUF484 family protein [Alcanivoracaceae bacterium]|nr:DUF484 family protein [Alcanivoracaceae bacterium]
MSEDSNIKADQVAAWLRDHIDFFQKRPELLELIRLPDPRGPAVSLLERQAQILRERNEELRNRLNNLIDVARENDSLFEKTRKLTLALVEQRTPETLFRTLIDSLHKSFGSDAVALIVYDRDLNLSGELRKNVRCHAYADLPEALQSMLRSGNAFCGVLRPAELEQLFPEDADDVKSAAMVPLDFNGKQGLLAIGSFNAQHFRSSMGTLFVSHIGEVLARRLADLLKNHGKLEAKRA